jgi:hypothetical protein
LHPTSSFFVTADTTDEPLCAPDYGVVPLR